LDIEDGTFMSFYRLDNVQYMRFRTVLSAANRTVNRLFNGIQLKDVNWVKIYKREAIMSFPWKMESSIIESELCAKLLLSGHRVIEVLSCYHPRQYGKSKGASFRIVWHALRETLKLVWVVRQFQNSIAKRRSKDPTERRENNSRNFG